MYKKGKGFYHRDRLVVGVLFLERLPEFLPADPNKRNRINQEIKPKRGSEATSKSSHEDEEGTGGPLRLVGILVGLRLPGLLTRPFRSLLYGKP